MSEHDSTFLEMLLHLAPSTHCHRLTAISSEKSHSNVVRVDHQEVSTHFGLTLVTAALLLSRRQAATPHRRSTYAQQLREKAGMMTRRSPRNGTRTFSSARSHQQEAQGDHRRRSPPAYRRWYVLLASDGMWLFRENELEHLLHSLTPREASEEMMSLARERADGRATSVTRDRRSSRAPAERRH